MSTDPEHGYVTFGVDTQIPWPIKEQIIEFRGRDFYLLPLTDTRQSAIRVKLAPGFPKSVAYKTIQELLSALAWAEQAGAEGTIWTWGTVPINVGRGYPSAMTKIGWFDYLPDPVDPKAKLALALYREAMSVNLAPYKFLGFFKVINVIRDKGPDQKKWITANLQHVTESRAKERLTELQKNHADVAEYLYVSGRCAVAHAFNQPVVNPDDLEDLNRLNEDIPVIQDLARIAIVRELGIQPQANVNSSSTSNAGHGPQQHNRGHRGRGDC